MLPFFALAAQSSVPPEARLVGSKGLEITLAGQAIATGQFGGNSFLENRLGTTASKSLYLGYPHGPKTSEFVPAGRKAETLIVRLEGPIDLTIKASKDSFACTDQANSPIGSQIGNATNTFNNGIYDRASDWLLTAEGPSVSVSAKGRTGYKLHAGPGPITLRLRTDYYRNHLGYFLWDHTKPLWSKPVAGWCSWMAHLQDVKEGDMLAAATFFATNLKDYGYSVIQMDDGYQRVSQFPQGDIALKEPFAHYWTVPNEKFPNGLKTLAKQISDLGLTPGIWVGDYIPLGLNHADGYVKGTDGKPYKGPWVNYAMNGHNAAARDEAYVNTVRELRADGWRYFKIDTLRHVLYDSYRQVPDYWKGRGESMEDAYRTLLAETKKAAGKDNYLLACWGTIPELAGLPDGARIGEDVGPDVASMRRSAKYIAQFQYLNNVVWRNDPDYMCLRVPVEQAQSWATMTFLAGGHVMVSDPVKDYDAARVDILRKVGPPLITRPTAVVSQSPDPEFMTLNAEKGGDRWLVAARFGWGEKVARKVPFAELGLANGSYLAFDFWNEKFLGIVQGGVDFSALADGACQTISLRPLTDHPQVLGTNRHLGQGIYELDKVTWKANALSGQFKREAGREWSLYVHVPTGWHVESTNAAFAMEQTGEVCKLVFPVGSGMVDWKIQFSR